MGEGVKATATVEQAIQAPRLHLNGTGRDELLRQYSDAYYALLKAESAASQAAPHGRDYYVDGPDVYQRANKEHFARMRALESVRRELYAIMASIYEQGERRQ